MSFAVRLRRLAAGIPILMYHEISPTVHSSYGSFTVTPAQFDAQMSWLARKGYRTITLDDLLDCHAGLRTLPKKPLVITFDDGCRAAVEHAAATLPRYGFTAMFYLVAGAVGSTNVWASHRRSLPLLDWNMARALVTAGFACGSHTLNHRRLAQVAAAECREELRRSRAILQDRLGCDIVHLSYPHGSVNADVRRMAAEAGYRTACTVEESLSLPHDDLLTLPRVRVAGDETFRDFVLRVRTGRRLEQLLPRRLVSLNARARGLLARRAF